MAESRLQQLSALGQSVWIDYLSRRLVHGGELGRLIAEDAVVGVTSNPTIFQKAIAEGDAYDQQLREVLAEEDDAKEVFLRLAVKDVQDACDLLRPVWDKGQDGYVSIEVDPNFAYDTVATTSEAQRLHELVDRPNCFVKIPGTEPGLAAIEEMISRGRNINVTLIFSLERYAEVVEAYLRGLERLVEGGGDPAKVASVASFFVSRVDTEADRRLEENGRPRRAQGQARGREREARLPALQGALLRRALGCLEREGRAHAALPVGLDVDEEPGLSGRPVRRGADRPGDREHDARGDDRGLPGSRRGGAHARRAISTGRIGSSNGSPRRGSTTTTWSRCSSARACRSSPTRSRSCSRASAPSAASSSRPEPPSR